MGASRRIVRFGTTLRKRAWSRVFGPLLGTVTGVHTKECVAALTFDDGPHPEYTPRLLDILERHEAKGTFFMLGKSAESHRSIVERAAAAGHVIANHTWDHPAVSLIGRRERLRQILACEQVLTPYLSKLFRPPYGFQSPSSYFDARGLGYTVVGWSASAKDWLNHPAEEMTARLAASLKPGGIVLLHDVLIHTIDDSYADRTPLLEAVDRLLSTHSDGFRFLTVPDLLSYGRVRRVSWFRSADRAWLNGLNGGRARQY